MLDVCISLVITLFILSMVTEKLTQLIKNYSLFFNILFTLVAASLLARATLHLFKDTLDLVVKILGVIVFAANSVSMWLFTKAQSRKLTLGVLVSVGILNLILIFTDFKFALYLPTGALIGYFAMISLFPDWFIAFRLKNKVYNNRLFKRINAAPNTPPEQDKRGKEITMLSFLTGLFIAYLFHASFLDILDGLVNPGTSGSKLPDFSWPTFPFTFDGFEPSFESFHFSARFAVGIMLTGFFLSFGSSFFHDLLEMLFYAKKAKGAISDPDTYQKTSADEVEKWVENYQIENFYFKHQQRLMKMNQICSVSVAKVSWQDKSVLGLLIYTKDNRLSGKDIKHLFVDRDANGMEVKIPFEVKFSDARVELTVAEVGGVDAVINSKGPIGAGGSLGCALGIDGTVDKYVMSCFHVVKSANHSWDFSPLENEREVKIFGGDVIGDIVCAALRPDAEAALIKLRGFVPKIPFFPGLSAKPLVEGFAGTSDEGMQVYMYSRKGNKRCWGYLRSVLHSDDMPYEDISGNYQMKKLLMVVSENGGHLQQPGDSGNLLFNSRDEVIGMVFGRKIGEYTLAFSIASVLDIFRDHGFKVKLN